MNLLSKIFRRRTFPPLDVKHPKTIELSKRLRVLRAMPIRSKEERASWYAEADKLRERLYEDYKEIYDSLPHEIEHYLVDADIRAKDAGYARYQENLLADLLSPPTEEEPNQAPEPTAPSGRGSS